MEQTKIVHPSDIKWEEHPVFSGLRSAMLVSNRDDQMDLTCMLTRVSSGTVIDMHTHTCDEIIYVIEGDAVMSIEGMNDIQMTPGTFLRIPTGVKHQPHAVKEDMLAYNVFYPFLK
jgi:quercetin dioxygenase-like cupin family protein